MRKNKDTSLHGQKVVLVPYREIHVLKYHGWMQREELRQLTASEPLSLEQEFAMQQSWLEDSDKCTFIVLDANMYKETGDEVESMIGDVNLFFNDEDDHHTAEIEIMIAETSWRGKGCGMESLLMMMQYGVSELGLTTITAKVGLTNLHSQALFTKIGFTEVSRSAVFEEVTLELPITDPVRWWLQQQCEHVKTVLKVKEES